MYHGFWKIKVKVESFQRLKSHPLDKVRDICVI